MAAKIPTKKSRSVLVVYFGSPDDADLPSKLDYEELDRKLRLVTLPDDIKAFPSIIAGNKLLKVEARTEVFVDGDIWAFKPTRYTRSRPDIENDPFVKLAAAQLEEWASDRRKYILVPYYAKLEKKP